MIRITKVNPLSKNVKVLFPQLTLHFILLPFPPLPTQSNARLLRNWFIWLSWERLLSIIATAQLIYNKWCANVERVSFVMISLKRKIFHTHHICRRSEVCSRWQKILDRKSEKMTAFEGKLIWIWHAQDGPNVFQEKGAKNKVGTGPHKESSESEDFKVYCACVPPAVKLEEPECCSTVVDLSSVDIQCVRVC